MIHRYADRVLFLPVQTCPVYCRFCTRSYAIGPDTHDVDKLALGTTPADWRAAFDYIAARPEIEDVVISGGDAYQLAPRNITLIGETPARDPPRASHALRNQRHRGDAR